MTGGKQRRRQLQELVRFRIAEDEDLQRRYRQKGWTRFWHRLGQRLTWGAWALVAMIGVGGCVLFGAMLIGVKDLAQWMETGIRPSSPLPPLLAGWSLAAFVIMLFSALRFRKSTIVPRYRPWGVILPIRDARLIAPYTENLMMAAIPVLFIGVGAFSLAGIGWGWEWHVWGRVALVVVVGSLSTWVLAELIAVFLPLTPMVETTLVLVLISLGMLIVSGTVVPRTLVEVVREELYGPIWALPPAGWWIGLTGLLSDSWMRNWALPAIALVLSICAWWRMRSTLELRDIHLGGSMRVTALRSGWLRRWQRPKREGAYTRYQTDPDKARAQIRRHREYLLGNRQASSALARCVSATQQPGERSDTRSTDNLATGKRSDWLRRVLFPWRLSPRQLACLGLLGLHHPKRGRPAEFLFGLWPVPIAIGYWILNQFIPLIGAPAFLRLPLVFAFALSLLDFRELSASTDKGDMTFGFTIAHSVFPISFWYVLSCLLAHRLLILWTILPGWGVAIGLLSLTDLPVSLIVHPPLLLAAVSLTLPCLGAITYGTSNLRSCWQVWTWLMIPLCLLIITFCVVIQFGVFGYLVAIRPNASWRILAGASLVLVAVTIGVGVLLSKGTFDEGVSQLNRAVRRRG